MPEKLAFVIEDVVTVRRHLEELLREKGYAVYAHDDAKKVIKAIKQLGIAEKDQPTVVISDLYDSMYSSGSTTLSEDAEEIQLRIDDLRAIRLLLPNAKIIVFSLIKNLEVPESKMPILEGVFQELASIGISSECVIPKLGANRTGFPTGYKLIRDILDGSMKGASKQ
jgi:CheY-like chemotaxis protein